MMADANKLIQDLNSELANEVAIVADYDQDNQNLIKQLEQVKEQKDAWYRQPQYVIPMSLLVGILGGEYLAHNKGL